ncbi:hypothetical protein K435DRAFT_847007 [Dendrothele bispora CBS 962.96]|uniref:Uncharacterized protein n=1 Tax=Dendrothele bispora (strain CBS 962.96) TaxID=1314807 RepID=A0A4S8MZU9_DENBC|nr:hypothetical protein K435DRAFT_847007 [Dendrothele bispora CBS 962.96]
MVFAYSRARQLNEPTLLTTTVRDYDLSEMSMFLRSVYIDIRHNDFHIKFTQPLLIQSLMGFKGLHNAPSL